MTKIQQDNIFEDFNQGDPSINRTHGGTGLGLSLSRQLAQLLGGDLLLLQSSSEGSTFQFSFTSDSVPAGKALPLKAVEARANLSGKSVLVVDDAPDNLLLASRMLTKLLAKVQTASTGHQALHCVQVNHFDYVLLDIQMPDLDGYQTLRLLRENGFRGPVIALTAHAMKEEREKTAAAGFYSHLTKPINQATMLENLL